MLERPILRLPEAEADLPNANSGRPPLIKRPSRSRQVERLSPKFERLSLLLAQPNRLYEMRSNPASLAPERAIVFEVRGSVELFYENAASIGLEFLADDDVLFSGDDDFYSIDKQRQRTDKPILGRVYMAMPDLRALEELLRVWEIFKNSGRMPDGFGMWTSLFQLLGDIRPWGPEDRLTKAAVEDWRIRLAEAPTSPVRFEIELWFRENESDRARCFQQVEMHVGELGGTVVHHAVLPEIRYDAALIDLPANQIQSLIENPQVSIALNDEIWYVRPQSMISAPILEGNENELVGGSDGSPDALGEPIAALLDGLPIENHTLLSGRLVVDDPEEISEAYLVRYREHGTQMASLIVHGDLGRQERPLTRKLYVRPVLIPEPIRNQERAPNDRLVVDLIYRAVRRLKIGDGESEAVAPDVILINISLGDKKRAYAGQISPWARMLDYLSYEFKVLFLVSAGNVSTPLRISTPGTWMELEDASPNERERAVLMALDENKVYRSLLSPGEAINAITVGAAHSGDDGSGRRGAATLDPYCSKTAPNISSALGLGHKKAVKPDLLIDGGCEHMRLLYSAGSLEVVPLDADIFRGLLAAAPDRSSANLGRTSRTMGTSAATALATRLGHQIYDVLMDRDAGSLHTDVPLEYRALLVKALLIHGASWGTDGGILEDLLPPRGSSRHAERRNNITRMLGFGYANASRMLTCTANRATLLGYGVIGANSAKTHRIPLPSGFNGVGDARGVTLTLTWFTPIALRNQKYRAIGLDLKAAGDDKYSLGVERKQKLQPPSETVKRGTVHHEHLWGERATSFVDNGDFAVRISCSAVSERYNIQVPYALAVTIEVGVDSSVQVYDEIRAAIETQARPSVRATI